MTDNQKHTGSATIDSTEVDRFSAMAADWWNPSGKFRPLHQLTPVRVAYIRNQICDHFDRQPDDIECLKGLTILDVGCGGGLIAEPVKRLGGNVTAIDPSNETIIAAKQHAEGENLDITYRNIRIETLLKEQKQFDVLLCLEVIEHLPSIPEFLKLCSGVLRPGGIIILSTLNRTLKSFALAIVGAEYILRWLPVGTHKWDQFVTPGELGRALESANLKQVDLQGVVYDLLSDSWQLSTDIDVNYFMTARSLQNTSRSSRDIAMTVHP